MTHDTARKILALISAAHGTETSETTIEAWQIILHDLDDETAINATVAALRSSHYPPKPADILIASHPPLVDANAAYLEWRRESNDAPPIIDHAGRRRYRLAVWSNPLVPAAGQHLSPSGEDEFATRQSYVATNKRLEQTYTATGQLPAGVDPLPAYQPAYSDEAALGPVIDPGRAPQLGERSRAESDLAKQLVRRARLAAIPDDTPAEETA